MREAIFNFYSICKRELLGAYSSTKDFSVPRKTVKQCFRTVLFEFDTVNWPRIPSFIPRSAARYRKLDATQYLSQTASQPDVPLKLESGSQHNHRMWIQQSSEKRAFFMASSEAPVIVFLSVFVILFFLVFFI